MSSELVIRSLIGAIFVGVVWMVTLYRRWAQAGESYDLKREGWHIAVPLRLAGVALWLYLPAYVLIPRWMAWSTLSVPDGIRWTGLVVAGLVVPPFVHWAQRSLGRNVTTTVITKRGHQLVTTGPYRYIRHPLYTAGMVFFLAMSLASASWFLPLLMLVAFPVLLARTPKEEAALADRFGEAYRAYCLRTGRFLPRLRRLTPSAGTDE